MPPKIFIPLSQQRFIVRLKTIIDGRNKTVQYEDINRDWSKEDDDTKRELYKDIFLRKARKTTDVDKALRDIFVFEDEEGTKKVRKSPVRRSIKSVSKRSVSKRSASRRSIRKSRSRK